MARHINPADTWKPAFDGWRIQLAETAPMVSEKNAVFTNRPQKR